MIFVYLLTYDPAHPAMKLCEPQKDKRCVFPLVYILSVGFEPAALYMLGRPSTSDLYIPSPPHTHKDII